MEQEVAEGSCQLHLNQDPKLGAHNDPFERPSDAEGRQGLGTPKSIPWGQIQGSAPPSLVRKLEGISQVQVS